MLTDADIREALRDCYDASHEYGKPLNIVDLGLIVAIDLERDADAPGAGIAGVPQKSSLVLTLMAPSDDEDAQVRLAAQIANRLGGLQGLSKTDVVFAAQPQWTPACITGEGRKRLQLDFPILNNLR